MTSSSSPDHNAHYRNWGYGFAFIGTLLFAMKAILVKLAFTSPDGEAFILEPATLLFLRMAFAVPVYLLIGVWLLRARRAKGLAASSRAILLKSMAVGCLAYYVCSLLDFTGLTYITAQLERLLLYTYPVFVFILGAMFFGERLTRIGVLSIAIAYSGIALIFAGGDIATGEAVAFGSALVVICAFFYGLSQLLSKSLIGKLGGALYTCVAMSAAGGAIFTHFLMANWEDGIGAALDLPPRIFALGAMIAVFSTVLPSFFINIALGRIGPQAVAIMGMLSPVATIIVAIIVLGEPFGPLDALGTAVTMVGIGLYTVMDRRAKTAAA